METIYSARKLLQAEPLDVLNNFLGVVSVEFDNGEVIKSTGTQLAISRYAWEIFKEFDKINILPRHHVSAYMKEETNFTPGTVLQVMSVIATDIFDTYKHYSSEEAYNLQDKVWGYFLDVNNRLMNDIMIHCAENRSTLNIEDILQIMKDEDILRVKRDNPVTKESMARENDLVERIYSEKKAILDTARFKENNICIMMRSGTIKVPQLMQCIGPRGSVTDMNSSIFAEPIQDGYLDGFRRIYDTLVESRTAAMSLNNQSGPLKFTEYLSRRVQLVGMELRNLHFGDCGSKHYLEFQVQTKSDLKLLESMNYVDELGNITPVRKNSLHLLGKRIKLRTVLGCQHNDPNGVCSVCFGEASRNIARYRNLGHYCVISLTEIITQLVLSTKHHTGSAHGSTINLTEFVKNYLREIQDGYGVTLTEDVYRKYKNIKLIVSEEAFNGLTDIKDVDNITILSPKRTTHVNRIKLLLTDKKDDIEEVILDVVPFKDEGYLSMNVLRHMKNKGWEVRNNEIEIDLTDFNINHSLIEITAKQFDMFAYSKGIEKILKSSVKDIKRRANDLTPEMFLMELMDAITLKLDINMAIMQVVAYTMLCTDIQGKDYSLPKPWTKHGVGTMDHIITGRCLSAALAYEKQGDTLLSPHSFSIRNRPDSPMAEFFVPDKMKLDYLNV